MVMMIGQQKGKKVFDQGRKSGDGEFWCRGRCLGKGSFGSVYLATTKIFPAKLKSYPPQMAVKSANYSASSSLQWERKVLNNLKDFRHVIRCFGEEITAGEGGEKVYNLLLEYASGGSLYDMIFNKTSGCGLPESDVRRYTRSILEGIRYVHESGYAHLDIKPDNILLVPTKSRTSTTTTYEAKVCDFGLAMKVKERIKKTEQSGHLDYLRGTPGYMPPEAAVEGIQGPPSDIWALGCVVLEMLTGKRVELSLRKPMIPRDISHEAKEFLRSCFTVKVEDRLTARELLELEFVSLPTTLTSTPYKASMNRVRRLCRICVPLMSRAEREGYGRIGKCL